MKSKTILFLLLVAVVMTACSQNNKKEYTINGSFIQEQNEEWVYLQKMFTDKLILDSARIENGKFIFKGKAPDFPEAYALSYHPLRSEGILFPVFVEPGVINIKVDRTDWGMKSIVEGGKVNTEYSNSQEERNEKYFKKIMQLNDELNSETITPKTQDSIQTLIKGLWKEAQQYDLNYIKKKVQSPVSLFSFTMIFNDLPLEEISEILQLYSENAKQTDAYKMIEKYYQDQQKVKENIPHQSINAEPITFDARETSIIETVIANNKGKVIYVDMWATWCGNCLKEFPYSKALHQKTDKNNVSFVYLAMDSQLDKWKEIIKEQHLEGQHFFLNKEIEEKLRKEYFGKSPGLPRYMIINKNGEVVNTDAPRPSDKEAEKLLKDLINPKIIPTK